MIKIKRLLNVLAWIITLSLQAWLGFMYGFLAFDETYDFVMYDVVLMWVVSTIAIFLVGFVALLFRRSISPKRFPARLGLTAVGVSVPIAIYYFLDVLDPAVSDLSILLLTTIMGVGGFYIVGWVVAESRIAKILRSSGHVATILFLIVCSYKFWDFITPFWLPYHLITTGQSLNVELVNKIDLSKVGGGDVEIFSDGAKGVLLSDRDLYFIDLSDPISPTIYPRYSPEDLVYVLKIEDNLLYIYGWRYKSYKAINFSDPIHPKVVWQQDKWSGYDQGFLMLVHGIYAFMINPEGFHIYDMSKPSEPLLVGHQVDTKGFERIDDYAFSEHYLYILDGRNIRIFDTSNLTNIVEVGEYNFPSEGSGFRRITIIDDLAFLDNSPYRGFDDQVILMILDISNPAEPQKVTSYRWDLYSGFGGSSKESVYIADYNGLHIMDFSNPKRPKEIGYYGFRLRECVYDCLALGQENFIYVVANPNELYVFQFYPPEK